MTHDSGEDPSASQRRHDLLSHGLLPNGLLPSGIGWRLLGLIVLFSSFITLLLTAGQLYLDFRRDVRVIEHRLDDIGRSALGSLAAGLWNVDAAGLHLQLDGFRRLPDLQMLEVIETPGTVASPLRVTVGAETGGPTLERTWPLVHTVRGEARPVGTLRAVASLDGVYDRLRETVIVILISQGLKTFVVSLFTLYIVHRLITRHLVFIAAYFARFDSRHPGPPLCLPRRPPGRPDEFDQLVAAFGAMADGLRDAYQHVAAVNRELEWDIAERQARERELQLTLDTLAAANRDLERFAFIASHDLQEPLRSIVSFTQLLARHYAGRLDERADRYMDYIVTSGQRMHNLINDLLAYSHLEQREMAFAPVDCAAVWSQARESLSETVTATGATLDAGPLPVVHGDAGQILQLFRNLLSNALKFHQPETPPHVQVAAVAEDGMWHFTLADDGIGMETGGPDPFDIFRRQHPAHAYPGTGVGLAICKRVVLRHGGRIWVESRPGQGATFHFTLPAADGGKALPLPGRVWRDPPQGA